MENLTISVIIRTKNSEKTIDECLRNIQNQTFKVHEIIIVDSGSTDNTLKIVSEFGCRVIFYPKEIPFNYSKALNIGIEVATSQYILNVSSHVILQNTKTIEFMLHFLQLNQLVIAVSTMFPVGKNGRRDYSTEMQTQKIGKVQWDFFNKKNFKGFAMCNTCGLFERKYWLEYPFNENMLTAEEQEWIYHFMKKYNRGSIIITNPYVLYKNPYINVYKANRDVIALGRYVYPPLLSTKHIIKLLTVDSFAALFKTNLYRVYRNWSLALALIKERLGFKMKISSNYSNKLET